MKKVFLLSVIVIIAGLTFYRSNSNEMNSYSEIKMSNIEALVKDEGGLRMKCYKTRTGVGMNSFELYCQPCSYMFADVYTDYSYCSN